MKKSIDDVLINACSLGDGEAIIFLIGQGADIHFNQDHPLREAAACGHLGVVKFLIGRGADRRAGQDGENALYWARYYKQKPIIEYLQSLDKKKGTADLQLRLEKLEKELAEVRAELEKRS